MWASLPVVATNNQVEYEALLMRLRVFHELGVPSLKVFINSQLVARQVSGEYEARDPQMMKYLEWVCSSTTGFRCFSISHIPRGENARVDALSRLATLPDSSLGCSHIEYLENPSYKTPGEVQQVTPKPSWMDQYIRYITDGILSTDQMEAGLVKKKAA